MCVCLCDREKYLQNAGGGGRGGNIQRQLLSCVLSFYLSLSIQAANSKPWSMQYTMEARQSEISNGSNTESVVWEGVKSSFLFQLLLVWPVFLFGEVVKHLFFFFSEENVSVW